MNVKENEGSGGGGWEKGRWLGGGGTCGWMDRRLCQRFALGGILTNDEPLDLLFRFHLQRQHIIFACW